MTFSVLADTDLRWAQGGALNAYLNLVGQKSGQIKGSVTQAPSGTTK